MPRYWIEQWLDENEVANEWEIDHLLHTQRGVKSLMTAIEGAVHELRQGSAVQPNASILADSIVAGRRLDLSGKLSCFAYDCMRRDIDSTFKNVWHYFDSIVVEGLSPITMGEVLRKAKGNDNSLQFQIQKIREQARLFLYLRSIGADKFVIFTNKTFAFCENHWLEHAKTLGIADAFDKAKHDSIIREIVNSSHFEVDAIEDGMWAARISSPIFDTPNRLVMFRQGMPEPEDIACSVLDDLATATISDVELARRLSLPLIEPTSLTLRSSRHPQRNSKSNQRSKANAAPSTAEVAVSLSLPVFDNLSTENLIKIREDERPDFEAFRSALRSAIHDKLASAEAGVSASEVARSIDEEYLRPGLAEIERKLRSSRQAAIKKTVVDLTIGAAAAGVATISSVPLMIAGGVAALGSSVPLAPVIHKYIEDRRAATMSEFYFLWHVGKRAEHKL